MPTFTMVNEDEALLGSVVVDRYHVSEVIGSGTAGTVFGVDHLAFRRHSAMKVLRPRYATAELVHRVFHNEGRTAWTVSHPCLTEVFDISQLDDGTPFILMERLEGETLATRIRRERLSLGAAVDVIMQVLSALDAIHQRDLLLRGLVPHNILLATRKGCRPIVKILDFGLARLTPIETIGAEFDAVRLASAGEEPPAVATPFYFAPERLRGEHLVTRASDIYVSMVVFFEALAGRRPFEAATFDGLVAQISSGKPPRISELRSDVPPDLDNLMARALSADPHSRPLSARDLQEEIRAIFDAPRSTWNKASTQLRVVPVALPAPPRADIVPAPTSMMASSHVDSAAYTPRQPLSSETQPHQLHQFDGMMYEEETRTDRSLAEITLEPASSPMRGMNHEASAESPYRTVPPPPAADASIDVVIDEDTGTHQQPVTSPGSSIDAAIAEMMRASGRSPDEEETETLQLTPEFRARIEQMQRERAMHQQPTQQTIESRPPPTRRVGKPDS